MMFRYKNLFKFKPFQKRISFKSILAIFSILLHLNKLYNFPWFKVNVYPDVPIVLYYTSILKQIFNTLDVNVVFIKNLKRNKLIRTLSKKP